MSDAPDHSDTQPDVRLEYATPRLVCYGAVHQLTAAGSTAGMENFGAMGMITHMA